MVRISFLVTALLSFALSALSGFIFIPWLRKLKFGQTILEIGPNWHRAKQGTPTMGGTEKAGEIYKKIKPLIKDKKGTDNGNAV